MITRVFTLTDGHGGARGEMGGVEGASGAAVRISTGARTTAAGYSPASHPFGERDRSRAGAAVIAIGGNVETI